MINYDMWTVEVLLFLLEFQTLFFILILDNCSLNKIVDSLTEVSS